MRSRYSAFVRRDGAYLLRTLHPVERAKPKAGDFRAAFRITWTGLEVLSVTQGGPDDLTGMVHFKAHYQGGVLEERSRFVRIDGAWLYRDGKG
jgi:SEC-C motif-containing protein